MKKLLLIAALASPLWLGPQAQAQDVNLSLQFGQPGFYGQVDIGNFPRPQLMYDEPLIIERVGVMPPPLYLIVPPGHIKHWEKHCYRYNACGRPVYFVNENWYNTQVVPRYRDDRYRDERYRGNGDHDDDHDHGRGRDKDQDHDRGHGRGRHDD